MNRTMSSAKIYVLDVSGVLWHLGRVAASGVWDNTLRAVDIVSVYEDQLLSIVTTLLTNKLGYLVRHRTLPDILPITPEDYHDDLWGVMVNYIQLTPGTQYYLSGMLVNNNLHINLRESNEYSK